MGSEQLSQRPLLVLTETRAQRVGLVPTQKYHYKKWNLILMLIISYYYYYYYYY